MIELIGLFIGLGLVMTGHSIEESIMIALLAIITWRVYEIKKQRS